MNLRKEDLLGIHKDRIKIGASLADVDPMQIDQTVCICRLNWTTKILKTFLWLLGFLVQVRFDSIGGLGKHISALKEMVVFPLLYPEVFEKFKIQPPRYAKWQIFTLKCLFGWLTNSLQKWEVMLNITFGRTHVEWMLCVSRGCLFYGPPGTGKTLVARALANECSQGERKVAFFMRKGADCLSKWVGESERQLRLLFDQVWPLFI